MLLESFGYSVENFEGAWVISEGEPPLATVKNVLGHIG